MAVRTAPEKLAAESEQAEQTISSALRAAGGIQRHAPRSAAVNEPVKCYAPGSPERAALKTRLKEMAGERIDIPIIIGGKEIRTGETAQSVMPHDHRHVLADWHKASPRARRAGDRRGAQARAPSGRNWAWEDRAAVFLKAAELLATTWRAHAQRGDDARPVEDGVPGRDRRRVRADRLLALQCRVRAGAVRRAAAVEQHDVESARLSAARRIRLRGDAVQLHVDRRQPADRAGADGQHGHLEAGVERDALGVLHHEAARGGGPAAGRDQLRARATRPRSRTSCSRTASSPACTSRAARASSTACGRRSARTCRSIATYPRIVGETGGKDFIVAHPSADPQALAVAIARGGFEYQGQKCSAASRVYVPRSLWNDVRDRTVAMMDDMRMGDITDFRNFVGAVIDEKAFKKISEYLDDARTERDDRLRRRREGRRGLLHQADARRGEGRPTIACCARRSSARSSRRTSTTTPSGRRRSRSIDATSPYALTGAVFANDRSAVREAMMALRNAAGNFYVNDKPTGAVVGQQPFGGARASGTNDKAGSKLNLVRWVSARSIKETFSPPLDYKYPFMAEE